VPAVVVDHVRGYLELGGDVAAVFDSPRSLWRHRDFVRSRLGVVHDAAQARRVAEAAIAAAALVKDNPAERINVAWRNWSANALSCPIRLRTPRPLGRRVLTTLLPGRQRP
jgi:hypothetical protein